MSERALHRFTDRLLVAAGWASAAFVAAGLGWVLLDVVTGGIETLSLSFLLEAPRDAGRAGGIGPVLVSTALVLGICLLVVVPMGLGAAVALAETTTSTGRSGRLIRGSLDVLAGVPSIVFGLFGNALFGRMLGLGFSILSGGLTLACMVLPFFVRSAEAGLAAVPRDYRLGAAALGMTRVRTLWHLLLPAAAPALVAGLVLSIGRALAETAALLFTSGYVARMPGSLLDSGRTLTVHIYDLAMNVPGGEPTAWATALVLVLALVVIDVTVGWIGERWLAGRHVAT